ncbi:MAG: hypothetical protein NVSMB25_10460 [Thermoleophilaceae bacterium]
MQSRIWRFRLVTLLGSGALTVHELRFLVAPAPASLERAHGYIAQLAPALLLLLVLALAEFLSRVVAAGRQAPGNSRRPRGDRGPLECTPGTARLWICNGATLISVYAVQELLEGASGPGALVARGGWLAIPLAICVGLVVALLMRGAVAVEEWAAARVLRSPAPRPASAITFAPAPPQRAPQDPLCLFLAARGPPPAPLGSPIA